MKKTVFGKNKRIKFSPAAVYAAGERGLLLLFRFRGGSFALVRLHALRKNVGTRVTVLRNDREPLAVADVNDFVTLGVLLAVVTDRGVARNLIVLVDDGVADAAMLADVDVVQQDAVVNGRVAVDEHRVEENRVRDRAARNNAAVADDRVDRLADTGKPEGVDILVVDEFCRRKAEVVVVNRPLVVVEIKLRLGLRVPTSRQ